MNSIHETLRKQRRDTLIRDLVDCLMDEVEGLREDDAISNAVSAVKQMEEKGFIFNDLTYVSWHVEDGVIEILGPKASKASFKLPEPDQT